MAPAARTSRRQQSKQQPTLSSFSRVSKSVVVTSNTKPKSTVAKELALAQLQNAQTPQRRAPEPVATSNNKRKRDTTDSEEEHADTIEFSSSSKRTKVQLPTPPRTPSKKRFSTSPHSTEAQELISIFNAFLKAFALHRAHNGPTAPAEISTLLESVTRLYQKRAVAVHDLQRVLGVFQQRREDAKSFNEVQHDKIPFTLKVVGIGSSRRQLVELEQDSKFSERELQISFEHRLDEFLQQYGRTPASIPLLAFEMGTQTAVRQTKASDTLKHIMSGRKAELSMDNLSISDANDLSKTNLKSRTLSLFDRVKAKQLANAAVNVPSADVLRRKHALARIAEVVEILRMKQQQKLHGYNGGGAGGKVSFAMKQILSELRASMAIPMGEDEIKLCLEILANEVRDGWCSIFELGATKSVVLAGIARSGQEIVKEIQP